MHKLMRWLGVDTGIQSGAAGRRRIDLGEEQPSYPIYVIGDVHGCLAELKAAEQRIKDDISESNKRALIVLLGDYVDRGPHSSQVIDHLISTTDHEIPRIALCGNHDDVFLRFVRNPYDLDAWLDFGGRKTLSSYGIEIQEAPRSLLKRPEYLQALLSDAIPKDHLEFLESLPVMLRVGHYVFAHAGLRPGVPLSAQSDNDLMWIREPFLEIGPKLPYLVIHGHTPCKDVDFGPSRVAVDTGAYYSGRLSVLKIEEGQGSVLE